MGSKKDIDAYVEHRYLELESILGKSLGKTKKEEVKSILHKLAWDSYNLYPLYLRWRKWY